MSGVEDFEEGNHRFWPNEEASLLGPACREARVRLHAYVEGEVDATVSLSLMNHLASCGSCREVEERLTSERIWFLETALESYPLREGFAHDVIEGIREQRRAVARWRVRGLYAFAGTLAAAVLLVVLYRPDHGTASSGLAGQLTTSPARDLGPGVRVEPPRPADGVSLIALAPSAPPAHRIAAQHSGAIQSGAIQSGTIQIERGAYRVRLRVTNPSFGHVYGMAAQLAPAGREPVGAVKDDPCRPDPNNDGKTDLRDVVYSCQVILCGNPPSPIEIAAETPVEVDCEETCLRA